MWVRSLKDTMLLHDVISLGEAYSMNEEAVAEQIQWAIESKCMDVASVDNFGNELIIELHNGERFKITITEE